MTAPLNEEIRPVCLDRILNNCHPVDVANCLLVTDEFNGTAVESLRYLLALPKRGVLLINWIFAFTRRYRRIFLNQCMQNGTCDFLQLAQVSNKLCELTLEVIGQNLSAYTGLPILIVDLGTTAHIPIPQDEAATSLLKHFHVDAEKWAGVVHAVAEQAAPSLQHLLILDRSSRMVDSNANPVYCDFPLELYSSLHIDEMLVKSPSLRTLYLPNLRRYEETLLQSKIVCRHKFFAREDAWKAVRVLAPEQRFAGIERLVLPTTTIEGLHSVKTLPGPTGFRGRLEMHVGGALSVYDSATGKSETTFGSSITANRVQVIDIDGYGNERGRVGLYEPPTDDVTPDDLKRDLYKFVENACNKLLNERCMLQILSEITLRSQTVPLSRILTHLHSIDYRLGLFDLSYFETLFDALLEKRNLFQTVLDFDAVGQPYEMGVFLTIFLLIFDQHKNLFENLFRNITIRLTANEPEKEVGWMFDGIKGEFEKHPEVNPSIAPAFKKEFLEKLDSKKFAYFPPINFVLEDIMEEWEWKKEGDVEAVDMDVLKDRVLTAFRGLSADAVESKKQLSQQPNEKAYELGLRSMLYGRMTSFEFRVKPFQNMEHDDDATWTYADELRHIEEQLMYEALGGADVLPADMNHAEAAEMFLMSTSDADEARPFPMLRKAKVRFDRAQRM